MAKPQPRADDENVQNEKHDLKGSPQHRKPIVAPGGDGVLPAFSKTRRFRPVSAARLALLLLQLVAGAGLAAWLWQHFATSSAPNQLPPRTVAVIVLGALVVTAVLGVTVVTGHEGVGNGVLLGLGVAAILTAAVRSRRR